MFTLQLQIPLSQYTNLLATAGKWCAWIVAIAMYMYIVMTILVAVITYVHFSREWLLIVLDVQGLSPIPGKDENVAVHIV